jgi:hypothetical protein
MSGELGFLDFLHDSIDPMYGSELMSDDFGSGKMDLLSTSLHETGLLHNNQHTEVTILATILIRPVSIPGEGRWDKSRFYSVVTMIKKYREY